MKGRKRGKNEAKRGEIKHKSELKPQKAATRKAKQQDTDKVQGGKGKPKENLTILSHYQKKARNDNTDQEIDSEWCCVWFW